MSKPNGWYLAITTITIVGISMFGLVIALSSRHTHPPINPKCREVSSYRWVKTPVEVVNGKIVYEDLLQYMGKVTVCNGKIQKSNPKN